MAMFLSAMVIYGSIGIFRRYLPFSSAVLACFRGAAGALFLFLAALILKKKLFRQMDRRSMLLLVISGIAMGFNWIFLFEAYNYTTVATATLCYYMEPTIVVLLSPLLFGEKITRKKGICALVSVIGMILVSGIVENGVPEVSELKGVLFGLGAAVLYAAVVIINKKTPGKDAYSKTILQLLAAAAALVPYIIVTGQDSGLLQAAQGSGAGTAVSGNASGAGITATVIIMLLIVGFVHTGFAYLMYFGSMDGLRAQTIAIFSYLDPITALILSAVILHEKMTVYGLIGSILIIGAALLSEIAGLHHD